LGHDVLLLAPGATGSGADKPSLFRHYGILTPFEIEWISSPSRRWFPWKAAARALKEKPDLSYCWAFQSAVLSLLLGIPTQAELHDLPAGRFGGLWLRLFLLIPGRKRLLPITKSLQELLHLPKDMSMVAPDGVDLERYASLPDPEQARRVLGLPQRMTVLCTGHLYPGRGVELFLQLASRFPKLSFVWVGGRKEDVTRWQEKSSSQKLENLTFTGFVQNESIPMVQAAADILLMPYEEVVTTSSGGNTAQVCSPMKMFEYMASNRVILSSDLPVLREILDETMAVFCPPGNADAWETTLNKLLQDKQQAARLASRALEAVKEYSWIARAEKTLQDFA
jgi:glycosyltransferase involved in cell wall biosynthesis